MSCSHANCLLKFEKICMKCQRGWGGGRGGGVGLGSKIRKNHQFVVFSQYQVTPEFGKGKFFSQYQVTVSRYKISNSNFRLTTEHIQMHQRY